MATLNREIKPFPLESPPSPVTTSNSYWSRYFGKGDESGDSVENSPIRRTNSTKLLFYFKSFTGKTELVKAANDTYYVKDKDQ